MYICIYKDIYRCKCIYIHIYICIFVDKRGKEYVFICSYFYVCDMYHRWPDKCLQRKMSSERVCACVFVGVHARVCICVYVCVRLCM